MTRKAPSFKAALEDARQDSDTFTQSQESLNSDADLASKIVEMQKDFSTEDANAVVACVVLVLRKNEDSDTCRLTANLVGGTSELHGILVDTLDNLTQHVPSQSEGQNGNIPVSDISDLLDHITRTVLAAKESKQ